jgi:hypothetical protein
VRVDDLSWLPTGLCSKRHPLRLRLSANITQLLRITYNDLRKMLVSEGRDPSLAYASGWYVASRNGSMPAAAGIDIRVLALDKRIPHSITRLQDGVVTQRRRWENRSVNPGARRAEARGR